jgi:hypothetical protein
VRVVVAADLLVCFEVFAALGDGGGDLAGGVALCWRNWSDLGMRLEVGGCCCCCCSLDFGWEKDMSLLFFCARKWMVLNGMELVCEDTYDTAAGDGTLTLFDRSGSSDGGCCESENGED